MNDSHARLRLFAASVLCAGALALYTAPPALAAQLEECTCQEWETAFGLIYNECESEFGPEHQPGWTWCLYLSDCVPQGGGEVFAVGVCDTYDDPPGCDHQVAPHSCQ